METNNQIVKPVPGVFTFVGEDGKNLRDIVMELNNQWSFYMVKRVGDDAQLEALEETLEDVEKNGVDRASMAAVEALNILPFPDHYPTNSYTLKRSKTQQNVACEEIIKQIGHSILSMIKRALKWVGEKIKAFGEFFNKAIGKVKREETDAFLKKVDELGFQFKMRSKEEIVNDEKLSPIAAAINDNYSQYSARAITDTNLHKALGAFIRHPGKIVDYLETNVDRLEALVKAVVTGKWDEGHEITSAESTGFKSTDLEKIFKLLNAEGDSTLEKIKSGYQTLADLKEVAVNNDIAFDSTKIADLCKHAYDNLKVETSLLLFSDADGDRIIAVSKRVHASLSATEKLVEQSKYNDRDKTVVQQIRHVSEHVHECLTILQFVTDVSLDFYDDNRRWLKRLYIYMVSAQPESTDA